MKRTIITLLFLSGVSILLARKAVSQGPAEAMVVEVDIFSGRPNPSISLTDAEVVALSLRLRALCTQASTSTQPRREYAGLLGYRGLRIHRSAGGKNGLSVVLSRQAVRFAKAHAAAACQDRLQAEASDLFADDVASSLEKDIITLAHRKGALSDSLLKAALAAVDGT